jgi:inner membrane protein involved in colicin E2 resistance
VNRGIIRYGIAGCIVALTAAVVYAVVRLYILSQRVDSSILLVNVIGFAAIAAVLIYLTKKYEAQSWSSYESSSNEDLR